MWAAWLRAVDGVDGPVQLTDPAGPEVLAEVEEQLGVQLPAELRSLLAETDGVADDEGAEPVWPAERIAAENLAARAPAGTREPGALPPEGGVTGGLLLFGDTGTEDMFAYLLDERGEIAGSDVYLWLADREHATWVAADLQSLLDDWFTSESEA